MAGESRREIVIRLSEPLSSRGAGGALSASEGPVSRVRDPRAWGREIQKKLLELPGKGFERVVLDFAGLPSVESGTLGAILLLRQSLAEEGCRLAVRGCSEPLLAALELLRLDRLVCPEP